jgi:hypothetical protein
MMEMIAAYLQQTPLVAAMGESMKTKTGHYWASVHKMIPSFSIMGISSEYEDMAKKNPKLLRWFGGSREEIDSLVLQLSTICNQACEE